ncbi:MULTISPECIES: biotin carboxylase N-terminal domain-containing protein [Streptomyces]|uniref:ATP-binding protein n=1 Tax=Streptomyces TaxID=1883 RepID=UPI002E178B64|nr:MULTISPECIES: biotin carboxylase N-terminal domain-containing protein [unclassified Streptomyces]
MISILLVANRGEIARRVIRTARAMGLRTVAVYSEPDAAAAFVRDADVAVPLPGRTGAETYLNGEAVLAAARRAGADAVHPGYGFLSENAAFAAACVREGLVFVGPPAAAMTAMAVKTEARRIAERAGVPVAPGAELDGTESPRALRETAARVGFPLLVKAASGGGGRGMRLVGNAGELSEAVDSARREADAAFGDGTVFLERYLGGARHIEVQVVADAHGTVRTLGDRDCSVQRRNQKVLEEAPAPGLGQGLRERMAKASVALARAVSYEGVGTVEFLVSGDEFFFLEMNTRLQVEHPVTEEVWGLDLVRLQVRTAAGERLDELPWPARPEGHAVEVRLCAEDPASGYLPSPGPVHRFRMAPSPGLRVESAVEDDTLVPGEYDSLIAKLIVHAPTRDEAVTRLGRAVRALELHGPATNRDQLAALLDHPATLASGVDTGFLDRTPELAAARPDMAYQRECAVAASVWERHTGHARDAVLPSVTAGFRNMPVPAAPGRWAGPRGETSVSLHGEGRAEVDGALLPVRVHGVDATGVDLEVDGLRRRFGVHRRADRVWVNTAEGQCDLVRCERFPQAGRSRAAGSLTAPLPGVVVAVHAEKDAKVATGDLLVMVEAMKMEHRIEAPCDGTVTELLVGVGDGVDAGAPLLVLD